MKKFASTLLAALISATISCAHVKTAEPITPAGHPVKGFLAKAWKFTNPYYNSNWKWWQKAVYVAGPGH